MNSKALILMIEQVYKPQTKRIIKKDCFLLSIDGGYRTCIACGKPLEYDLRTFLCKHKCNPKDIKRSDTIRERDKEAIYDRSRGHGNSYSDKITEGFNLARPNI